MCSDINGYTHRAHSNSRTLHRTFSGQIIVLYNPEHKINSRVWLVKCPPKIRVDQS